MIIIFYKYNVVVMEQVQLIQIECGILVLLFYFNNHIQLDWFKMMYQNYRILCLDPKSEVFYSMLIDYDTNPEIIVYKDIPEMVENKRKNELKKVREMCDLS